MKEEQMINTMKRYFFLVLALLLLSGNLFTVEATRWPNEGNLVYDGQYFVVSAFKWTTKPGPWTVEHVGYEHDLVIFDKNFFIGNLFINCTTFSNLPADYDDCNTAGTLDGDDRRIFSFGSYRADRIIKNVEYFGTWDFDLYAGAPDADVALIAQEVENHCHPLRNIWWMDGTSSGEKTLHTDKMPWDGVGWVNFWVAP